MENKLFESMYLVILGWEGGEFDCAACDTDYEVYQVLTDRIHDEIYELITASDHFTDGTWKNPEEVKDFAEVIQMTKVISDPDVIIDCYGTFFADSWWFKVIDSAGSTWFSYTPIGDQ